MIILIVIVLFYQNRQLEQAFDIMKNNNSIQTKLIEEKEEKINILTNNYEEVTDLIKDLEAENQELNQKIEDSKIVGYITGLRLERMGIDDYKSIEEDLLSKSELISIDGVLGGTMFFTDVHLLNEKWVYATFEDGHIMGSGLYRFEVLSPTEIKWEEIEVTSD